MDFWEAVERIDRDPRKRVAFDMATDQFLEEVGAETNLAIVRALEEYGASTD